MIVSISDDFLDRLERLPRRVRPFWKFLFRKEEAPFLAAVWREVGLGAGAGREALQGPVELPDPSSPGPAASREGPWDPSDDCPPWACNGLTPVSSPPQY